MPNDSVVMSNWEIVKKVTVNHLKGVLVCFEVCSSKVADKNKILGFMYFAEEAFIFGKNMFLLN